MSRDLFGGEQPRTSHDVTASGVAGCNPTECLWLRAKPGSFIYSYSRVMQKSQPPLLTRPRGLTVRPSSYRSNIPTDVGTHHSPNYRILCTWLHLIYKVAFH